MNNPYTSPKNSGQVPELSREPGVRRGYFLYVIATILCTSFLLDVFLLPSPNGLGFLIIATGPMTLYFHYQWMGVPTSGAAFGVVTAIATLLYLAIPNRGTLIVSIIGGIVWSLSGFFWIAMLA